jgi:hypothetical protein
MMVMRRAFVIIMLALSLLAGCILEEKLPVEEPPKEEKPAEDEPKEDPAKESPKEDPAKEDPAVFRGSLDQRLPGLWRFSYNGQAMEEIEITTDAQEPENLGALTYRGIYHSADLQEVFAGDIVYAANFSDKTGILIIEYWPGHKQVWVDWSKSAYPYDMVPRSPQPQGNFYGVYFLRLNEEGTVVMLVCTNDQSSDYGPTEALTLEEALTRFSEENREQWMHTGVGDPQKKVVE